jgi:hypothetical protein
LETLARRFFRITRLALAFCAFNGAWCFGGVFSIRLSTSSSRDCFSGFDMAPQPLSRVKRHALVEFGGEVLKPYPELCCIVMETISFGAQVEFNWSAILVDILRSDPKTGIAMYEALSGGESRRAALLGAAKSAMSDADFMLLQSIDIVLAPARRVRNDFVHHIWGISAKVPNALLLIDPKSLRQFEVSQVAGGPGFDDALVNVWKEHDLIEARETMRHGVLTLGVLSEGLAEKTLERPQIGASARQRLLSQHPIAQALHKMSQKSTPPALPKPREKKRPSGK